MLYLEIKSYLVLCQNKKIEKSQDVKLYDQRVIKKMSIEMRKRITNVERKSCWQFDLINLLSSPWGCSSDKEEWEIGLESS